MPGICGCDKGPVFADNIALKDAVNDYTSCLDDSNCDILTASSYQKYGPISDWCTTGITDMSYLFYDKKSFNEPIGGWDTRLVTTMGHMFRGASSFDQDLCAWSESFPYDSATNMFLDSGCTYTDTPNETTLKGLLRQSSAATPTPTKLPPRATQQTPPTGAPSTEGAVKIVQGYKTQLYLADGSDKTLGETEQFLFEE